VLITLIIALLLIWEALSNVLFIDGVLSLDSISSASFIVLVGIHPPDTLINELHTLLYPRVVFPHLVVPHGESVRLAFLTGLFLAGSVELELSRRVH